MSRRVQHSSPQTEAVRIVAEWLKTSRFPDRLVPDDIPQRARIVDIAYGIAKGKRRLLWLLRQCANRRVRSSALPHVLVGLYQLFYQDRLPDYVAVHETVEAAKASLRPAETAFVNAVLRRAARERSALLARLASAPLGIRQSHPDSLIQRWLARMTPQQTEDLCAWNNEPPFVTVRVRGAPASFAAVRSLFCQVGIETEPHPFSPRQFLVLPRGHAIPDLPGFAGGDWLVQDPSTAIATDLLNAQPGDAVLDACAAPGGKTTVLADRIGAKGRLVAADRHPDRIALLRNTIARLHLNAVHVETLDATDGQGLIARFGQQSFDRILIDAPCSNTGVLRRRPDARWRFSRNRLEQLCQTQRSLLNACAPLLKLGGTMVYSSCSLEPEENETLTAAWLADHPHFAPTESHLLFPPESGTDGVFAAALLRHRL